MRYTRLAFVFEFVLESPTLNLKESSHSISSNRQKSVSLKYYVCPVNKLIDTASNNKSVSLTVFIKSGLKQL